MPLPPQTVSGSATESHLRGGNRISERGGGVQVSVFIIHLVNLEYFLSGNHQRLIEGNRVGYPIAVFDKSDVTKITSDEGIWHIAIEYMKTKVGLFISPSMTPAGRKREVPGRKRQNQIFYCPELKMLII